MIKSSILPTTLKSFTYYVRKLPLFLQNSYGFVEHFRIWYDMMISETETQGAINVCDYILYLLDIFDENYLEAIAKLDGSGATFDEDGNIISYGTTSDILDKIGELFGVKRTFSVAYINDDYKQVTEEITLDNKDLLILIKAQIIKNYCEGTFEQIKGYYESAGLYIFVITSDVSATCNLFLADGGSTYNYSDNVVKMFKAGLLIIQSMGIQYIVGKAEMTGFLVWSEDSAMSNQVWDIGVWDI